MNTIQAMKNVRTAIDASPRKDYTAELHVQIIKYSDVLWNVTGKEFCAGVGIAPAYGTEFAKMRKIAPRLIKAGLNPGRI